MPSALPFLLAAIALGVLAAAIPAAYALRWLTFTYGARGLDPARRRRAAAECAVCLGAGLAFDGLLRSPATGWLEQRVPASAAALVFIAACAAAAAIAALAGRLGSDSLGAGGAVAQEALVQALCTILMLSTGSWIASGLLNGASAALRLRLLGDVTGPWETLFFFASSSPRLKWMLLAAPVVAMAVVGGLAWLLPAAAGAR